MAKKMSDSEKLLVGVGVGLGLIGLYYLTAGYDQENNAALIPDPLEDRIDRVVNSLNANVGKEWGYQGAETLKVILRRALPPYLVALVDVVYAVEQESLRVRMASDTKRRRAVAIATGLGLA
jgi:hypothetical protein